MNDNSLTRMQRRALDAISNDLSGPDEARERFRTMILKSLSLIEQVSHAEPKKEAVGEARRPWPIGCEPHLLPKERKVIKSVSAELQKLVSKLRPIVRVRSRVAQQIELIELLTAEMEEMSRQHMKSSPPSRERQPETDDIVGLLRFVKEITGRPHLSELGILLSRACNDEGLLPPLGADRLAKKLRYYESGSQRKPKDKARKLVVGRIL